MGDPSVFARAEPVPARGWVRAFRIRYDSAAARKPIGETPVMYAPRIVVLSLALAASVSAQSQNFVRDPLESHLPQTIASVSDMVLADVDGDDIDDLVVSSLRHELRGYAGRGDGTFGAQLFSIDGSRGVSRFKLADFNGDGVFDVLGVRDNGDLRLWIQPLPLVFLDFSVSPLGDFGTWAGAFDVGDIDGDGDLDIVRDFTQTFEVLHNDGSGQFFVSAVPVFAPEPSQVLEIMFDDVDGDTDLDAVVLTIAAPRLYENDGQGTFTEVAGALPAWTASPTSLVLIADSAELLAVDVDGDGDRDLLASWIGSFPLLGPASGLWIREGGVFVDETTTRLPAGVTHGRAAAADLDLDGDLDLLLGASPGGVERVVFNDGAGVFTLPAAPAINRASGQTAAVAVGDVDDDLDPDVLLSRHDSQQMVSLQLNDGAANFIDANRPRVEPSPFIASAVAVGDLDSDGLSDMVSVDFRGPDRVLMNRGSRGFVDESASRMPPGDTRAADVTVVDVDLDGDLDIVVLRQSGAFLPPAGFAVLANDGQGHFTEVAAVATPTLPHAIAVDDVTGDGLPDVVVGVGRQADAGAPNRLYVQPGWVDRTANFPSHDAVTNGVALGDVDGDGDVDLVFANELANRLYVNDGTGVFTSTVLPGASGTKAIGLGDVDDDGDLDLIEGLQNRPLELFRNDGSGTFTTDFGAFPAAPTVNARSIRIVDFDGTGMPYVLVGENDAADKPRTMLFRSLGTHFVSDGITDVPNDGSSDGRDLAVADMDGDGDLDIVVTGIPGPRVRYNERTPRLLSRTVPSPGREYTLRVQGDVFALGAVFILGEAAASVPIPTPIGLLELDPSTVVVSVPVQQQIQFGVELTLVVPTSTTLVGSELHWQAAVNGPVRLTNSVVDVIWP